MKTTFLLSLLMSALLSGAVAAETDLSPYQPLLERQQYRKLQQQLSAVPDFASQPQLQLLHYKTMLSLGEDEALEPLLEAQRKQYPADAELFYLSAANKFNLAQAGSLFSAPGRAKAGLALLQQAIALQPDEIKYQQALVSFYAAAPGIAGGDIDEAHKVAEAIAKKDGVQGVLAKAKVLQQDDVKKALQLLKTAIEQQPQQAELLQSYATLLSQDKQHQQASNYHQQAAALFTEPGKQYESLYQVGRLVAVEGIEPDKGAQALSRFIEFFRDSDHPSYAWALLRLAQIQLKSQNKAAAEQTIAPLLAKEPAQKNLRNELKTFIKQLKG